MVVLSYGPLDGTLIKGFVPVAQVWSKLTGRPISSLTRLTLLAAVADVLATNTVQGNLLWAGVSGFLSVTWAGLQWRWGVPRWGRYMADLADGVLSVRMVRELRFVGRWRLVLFGAWVFQLPVLAFDRSVAVIGNVTYLLLMAASYFFLTVSAEADGNAKDWVKAKAKELARLRAPVLVPSPAGP